MKPTNLVMSLRIINNNKIYNYGTTPTCISTCQKCLQHPINGNMHPKSPPEESYSFPNPLSRAEEFY